MINELRNRNFCQLLNETLIKYLNIAYLMVNINEYVWALIQLLNPNLTSCKNSYTSMGNRNFENIENIQKCFQSFIDSRFSKSPSYIPTKGSSISNEEVWKKYFKD